MNILKLICLTVVQLVKQVWFLPRTVDNAVKKKQRRAVLNEEKAERLDRIRNPSRYLGK